MRKLNIAIFEPTRMYPGGGQKNMPNIASYLSKKHNVTIFTQKISEEGLDFGKSKIRLIKPRGRFLSYLAFLAYKLRKEDKFDLVVYGCYPATFAAYRNSQYPSIHITHSPPRFFYDLKNEFMKRNLSEKIKATAKIFLFKKIDTGAIKRISKILGISHEIKNRIKKFYGRESGVFYPGINKKDYNDGKYENYILAPGRIVFVKRPEVIVDAMKYVKNNKIKVIMVGHGNMSDEIKKRGKKYKNFEFRGYVSNDELKKLYSNCLAIIYIPINEDYGYIPVEAAASGKAVIGSNEGGLKETVIDGKTGILIDDVNPEKLAEKIDYLANNKKIAIKMGKNGKKYCRKFYLENTFKVLDKTIEDLTS